LAIQSSKQKMDDIAPPPTRQQLIRDIESAMLWYAHATRHNQLSRFLIESDSDSDERVSDCFESESESSSMDDLLDMYARVEGTRYLNPRTSIPKSLGYRLLLFDLPEAQFRQATRMKHSTFERVLGMIQDHEIFQNDSRNPQTRVCVQLAMALERLGCDGNGVSAGREAVTFGTGQGTTTLFTRRVITALNSLAPQFITWPDQNERLRSSQSFEDGYSLPGAVGIVDGTHVVLTQKPGIDGETYFDMKSKYSIHLTVCLFFLSYISHHRSYVMSIVL
jgi:hypothetical protein